MTTIPDHVGREAVRLLNETYGYAIYRWPLNRENTHVITVAKLLMNPPAPMTDPDEEAAKRVLERLSMLSGYSNRLAAVTEQMRTDATPVAWMPIASAPKDGTFIFAFFQGTYESGKPDYFGVVKWGEDFEGWGDVGWLENRKPVGDPTLWQPLPAAPNHIEEPRAMVPATDVAALVEAIARDYWNMLRQRGGMPPEDTCPPGREDIRGPIAFALAPFTKGQP